MNLLLYELLIFSLLVPWCYSIDDCGSCTFECFACDCNYYCPSNSIDLCFDYMEVPNINYCFSVFRESREIFIRRVNVIITSRDDSDKFIRINNDDANYIYSIDFSNHKYDYFPISTEMTHLQKLNMSKNSLMEAKLSDALELSALSEIDFSYNTINTIELSSLEYPREEMKVLNLSHNNLVAIPDNIFSTLSKLEDLDLSHNYIDTLSVLSFEGIKNLMNLDVSHNRISNIDNSLFRSHFLQVVDLSHNAIEIIKSHDFEKLVNLRNLDLSSNKLQLIDKELFLNNNNLENINLSRNNLTQLPKDLFKNKHLTSFTIQGNHLEGALVKGNFEGLKVSELDLSDQQLTSIEDYAFFGLPNVKKLFLQDNNIRTLSTDAFRKLYNLKVLDLSNNLLTNFDFEKKDLLSLYSIILQNNYLVQIKSEYFHSLHTLQFLDLSNNKIVQFEKKSFMSLRDLINIQISNNPLSGALEESTFDGLDSLPALDISGFMLTTINNGSFKGMTQLKNLNVSHSNITEIQFNSFFKTVSLEIIDLSFNKLTSFEVNTTDLIKLNILLLNNNLLTTITSTSLKGLPRLTKLYISHNNITDIQREAFAKQIDLGYLDLSYNSEFNLNISHLGNAQYKERVVFHTNISFEQVGDIPLSVLDMSHSGIENVTKIVLNRFKQLDTLVLSNNNIVKVETGAFYNITKLRKLDLSFNKIKFIQPGAFKDNSHLFSLNMSHNSLTAVSYGVLRGLGNLNTIDVSYNNINSLESERFYEVRSLSVLIVDHNNISSVKADDFVGTSLSILSIGDNPLSCDILVNLKKSKFSYVITAIRLDERSDETVDGVTCNMDIYKPKVKSSSSITMNDEISEDIRDIILLHNMKTDINFINISKQIDKTSSVIMVTNNGTNVLLDKMLKVLTSMTLKKDPVSIPKDLNKIKQDAEDSIPEKNEKKLTEVESQISSIASRNSTILEILSSIEICVGITLLILVVSLLFILYRSEIFVPRSSTRNLPEVMDIATL